MTEVAFGFILGTILLASWYLVSEDSAETIKLREQRKSAQFWLKLEHLRPKYYIKLKLVTDEVLSTPVYQPVVSRNMRQTSRERAQQALSYLLWDDSFTLNGTKYSTAQVISAEVVVA